MNSAMHEPYLPLDWQERRLVDLAQYFNGYAFKPVDRALDGTRIIRIEQLNNPEGFYDHFDGWFPEANAIDDGDLIFSWSATLKVGIWRHGKGVLNQHLFKVIPKEGFDKRFIFYVLDFNMDDLGGGSHGSTMKHIKRGELERYKVWVPFLPEQQRIAEILSSVDEAIEQTEALIAKTQQIKAGLMHDLFTRGVTPNGQLRPPREEAPHLYKESPLGWIPKEWETRSLANLCGSDITYGIVQAGPHVDGGVPYIRTGDMAGDRLVRDKLLCTSSKIAAAYKRSEVRAGEIVCAIRATVGKVLTVPDDLDGANLTQGTARLSPKPSVAASFLLWSMRTTRTQSQLATQIKGTTFNEITLANLRLLPIATPLAKDEQERIASRLNSCDDRISLESSTFTKLVRLKYGLMHDLLTGRVRVNVSETASA